MLDIIDTTKEASINGQLQHIETACESHHYIEPTKTAIHRGTDDALKFTAAHENISWTAEEERRLVWKLDMRIIPLMFLSTLFTFFESQAYGNAAILGMVVDLKLYDIQSLDPVTISLHKYSWTASIGYFAVLVFQYPALLAAQKLRIGKLTGGFLLYVGLLGYLMVVVKDFKDTMVLRFFYGVGSVVVPLSIIIIPMWYTTKEQPLRTAIYFSGSGFGTFVGQALDYGLGNIGGRYAHHQWKWFYIILPSMTIAFGLVYLLLFPDSPVTCTFLNEREKSIAIYRLETNNTGIQARKFKMSQFIDCFKDPSLYVFIYTLFTFTFITSAISSFAVYMTQSLGYQGVEIVLKLLPVAAVGFVSMILGGIVNHVLPGHRLKFSLAFLPLTIVGLVLLWKSPLDRKGTKYAGLIIVPAFYGAFSTLYSILSSNIAGHTKKTTINGLVFIFSAVGGITGPFAFKGEEAADGYPTGIISCLILIIGVFIGFTGLFFHYKRFNSKQEKRMQDAIVQTGVTQDEVAFLDLTEKENVFFRYQL